MSKSALTPAPPARTSGRCAHTAAATATGPLALAGTTPPRRPRRERGGAAPRRPRGAAPRAAAAAPSRMAPSKSAARPPTRSLRACARGRLIAFDPGSPTPRTPRWSAAARGPASRPARPRRERPAAAPKRGGAQVLSAAAAEIPQVGSARSAQPRRRRRAGLRRQRRQHQRGAGRGGEAGRSLRGACSLPPWLTLPLRTPRPRAENVRGMCRECAENVCRCWPGSKHGRWGLRARSLSSPAFHGFCCCGVYLANPGQWL